MTAHISTRRGLATSVLALSACLATACGCNMASKAQNAEGVRQYQQGFYEGAMHRFQQAIYNDPKNADGYYNLAATYHQTGKLHQQENDLVQAENYYNQCLDNNPNHRDCHRALAVLLLEEKRDEEAFRLIEGWANRNPGLAEPKVELARLYEEFGDKENATQHLLDALAVEPNNARALAALGKLREDAGNHAQALADYQRSLWYDRFQPEVAARVAVLQSALSPSPLTAGSNAGVPTTGLPLMR